MSDSQSFDSLLSLAQNHLSKVSLSINTSEDVDALAIPKWEGFGKSDSSDVVIPPPENRFIIPALNIGCRPNTDVVAKQISNALKAKELKVKLDNEKRESEELKKKLKNISYEDKVEDIDFTEALNSATRYVPTKKTSTNELNKDEVPRFLPKFEEKSPSLNKFKGSPGIPSQLNCLDLVSGTLEPLHFEIDSNFVPKPLPNLEQRTKSKGNHTALKYIVCARYRPCTSVPTNISDDSLSVCSKKIKRFDFSSPSPDDIAAEDMKKIKNPPVYDLFKILGVEMSDSLAGRRSNIN